MRKAVSRYKGEDDGHADDFNKKWACFLKILSVYYGFYVVAHGGGAKVDRFILEALASRGHQCHVLIPTVYDHFAETPNKFQQMLQEHDIAFTCDGQKRIKFALNGVSVTAIHEETPSEFFRMLQFRKALREIIRTLDPEVILVSGSDRGLMILQSAVELAPTKVIYFARCTQDLGIGPRAVYENSAAADILRKARVVVSTSRYMQSYLQEHAGIKSVVCDVPVYGNGPFKRIGKFCNRHVTMINPCGIKGLSIFLQLSDIFPAIEFAAVPTWGTTKADEVRLRRQSNITLISASNNIDKILQNTKILLVPSLWDEVFGRIIVEAMARGIPVIASNVGGIPEAKLGIPYIVSVSPIEQFCHEYDERRVPVAIIPDQNIEPWQLALGELAYYRDTYERIAEDSYSSANRYIESLTLEKLESILLGTKRGNGV